MYIQYYAFMDSDQIKSKKSQPLKGRGACSNPGNRYARYSTEEFDDGWNSIEDAPDSIATVVLEEQCKTIISSNQSPDIPFTFSINPYRGCEHGCIYCYARPTHAYWDLSPGLDFETKIITKPEAARLLRKTISKPNYKCQPICIGANTDPYQPLEAKLNITRSILEVLQEFRHPFSIITKGQLIRRDIDILSEMAANNLCSVAVSVTTLNNELKRKLEPRAASGKARLGIIKALSDAGVRVTMLVAPIIPSINDDEMEEILAVGKEAGAVDAHYIFLRLPLEVSGLFRDWLTKHYPDRADHVMSLVQQSRGGRDYQTGFGKRMVGEGVFAKMINDRFRITSQRLGFNKNERFDLDTSQFRDLNDRQMNLF
ncbi:MAG: PA0069 family radical SAM protein [Gammaproteobacteria bacterium]|nr:PA0069 family radical SAM protein [Gammaproteobacteria bacterium]